MSRVPRPGTSRQLAPRPRSAPLAACGVLLAGLALVALARGHEEPPVPPVPQIAARDAGPPTEVARLLDERPIDINRASVEELQLLPRIGPTLAARIVGERTEHGPFRSVDDLLRVRGIGPRTLERLAPLATVRDPPLPPAGGGRGEGQIAQ